jgi:hypothetical protein
MSPSMNFDFVENFGFGSNWDFDFVENFGFGSNWDGSYNFDLNFYKSFDLNFVDTSLNDLNCSRKSCCNDVRFGYLAIAIRISVIRFSFRFISSVSFSKDIFFGAFVFDPTIDKAFRYDISFAAKVITKSCV